MRGLDRASIFPRKHEHSSEGMDCRVEAGNDDATSKATMALIVAPRELMRSFPNDGSRWESTDRVGNQMTF
jgi:hypothetical protein